MSGDGSVEGKIVVLGSGGVGKTSLVHRFIHQTWNPEAAQASTIGASFLTKRVIDDGTGTRVRLQIWDTAGQERFRSISRLYYRGTPGVWNANRLLTARRRKRRHPVLRHHFADQL
jgi:small GTP-binding protein